MQSFPNRRTTGFTLVELLIVIAIIAILAAILMPVFAQARNKAQQTVCGSNLRQIGVSLLLYAHDYDGAFPPVAVGERPFPQHQNREFSVFWGPSSPDDGIVVPGLLEPYVKAGDRIGVFACPVAKPAWKPGRLGVSYLYNDLAATRPQSRFVAPSRTVLLMDGTTFYVGGGHSLVPRCGDHERDTFFADGSGGTVIERGAVSVPLPLLDARHAEGVNTLLADGHLKWFKMTEDTIGKVKRPPVYSPDRYNLSDIHGSEPNAPDPGGDMKGFTATFHIR